MMADFIEFSPENIAGVIGKLNPDTPPVWGTMTAQHMLEHLELVLGLSRGRFAVSIVTPAEKIEKLKRIALFSDFPLKRDFPAPFLSAGLQPLIHNDLEEAVKALLTEIESYFNYWEHNPGSKFAHPVFGELSIDEWHLFHRKHFTHHFSQFGLL